MRISVSSKNEFRFYPEIADNQERPESERFCIVCRKINRVLTAASWIEYNVSGKASINTAEKLRAHIIRLENAPELEIGGTVREMTVRDLLDESYPELYPIIDGLAQFVLDLDGAGGIEIKKS